MRRNYGMRRNYVIRMACTSCRGKGTCTTFDITEYCASCCVNLQKTVKRPPLSDGIAEFRQPSLSLESQTKCFHSQVGCYLKKHNYNTPVRWLLLLLRYCLKWKYWDNLCCRVYSLDPDTNQNETAIHQCSPSHYWGCFGDSILLSSMNTFNRSSGEILDAGRQTASLFFSTLNVHIKLHLYLFWDERSSVLRCAVLWQKIYNPVTVHLWIFNSMVWSWIILRLNILSPASYLWESTSEFPLPVDSFFPRGLQMAGLMRMLSTLS